MWAKLRTSKGEFTSTRIAPGRQSKNMVVTLLTMFIFYDYFDVKISNVAIPDNLRDLITVLLCQVICYTSFNSHFKLEVQIQRIKMKMGNAFRH